MPASEKQVRVFISSTFRDMHAERDHLVTVVFPELRERVEQLGPEFFDVDLRWGVPAKDANGETANSWEYCRQWIDRVEPFFVCILGQRYGWVPEPEQLKARKDSQRQQDEKRSITDMEVRHAVLNTKLNRRSYFYLRATDAPATASEFVDPPPLLSKLEQLKNEVRTCGRPVRDYPCDWTGSGFAGMEEFGHRVLDDLWSGVLRDERYVSKEVWRQALGKDPDTDPLYTDESQPVPEDLAAKIVARAKPPPKEPLDAEREQMDVFAASRLRWFQGRTVELQQLSDFLSSTATDAPHLAVVAAAPGQGKSALLAHLHEQLKSSPDFVITHFVGATERSATAHALVERLLGELDRSGITWPAEDRQEGQEPKRDFNSLCLRLAQRLGDYASERHIVILLDALNQLSDGHNLHWLPRQFGSGVRVIVSCVHDVAAKTHSPEQRVLHALASRQPVPLHVPLGPLTEADVRTIVVAYLKEYCHELDREHLDTLCAISQARNPLYLLVMLNELRTLGGNDLNTIVPARIASMPQDHPDTVSLFRWVLQRLEVFGAEPVRWWCLYLAHGRVGMASHELTDLLARKLGADAAATALRIERGLRRYLQRRGPQLDFFHDQLRQAVLDEYGSQAEAATAHHEMADYFTSCAKGTDPQKEWETDSVRGFAECVFHLTQAGHHEPAGELLSSFPFLLHKVRLGLLEGVFEDYDTFRHGAPKEMAKRLEIWADFFREKAHILRRGNDEWPAHKILLQLAIEHADDSPLTMGAERWLGENHCDWFWLRRIPRSPHHQQNPCLAVLEGHSDGVNGALVLADGTILSWSNDHTLRLWDGHWGQGLHVLRGHAGCVRGAFALADGGILSWSSDKTIRLWDAKSGQCFVVFEGHSESVNGAKALAGGRLLSWSADGTLRIWNVHTARLLKALRGHKGSVDGVILLDDGSFVSWSHDNELRLWDNASGQCLRTFRGHTEAVNGVLYFHPGKILSWSSYMDNSLRAWNLADGECVQVLCGHTSSVEGATLLSNGRVLSWSHDSTLRIWNIQSGQCLSTLSGHRHGVLGAVQLEDGNILSWAWDQTARVWNCETGECLRVFQGHDDSDKWDGGLHTFGVTRLDQNRIVTYGHDAKIRIWRSSGDLVGILRGHDTPVGGLIVQNGQNILSWSSGSYFFGHSDSSLRLWRANAQSSDADTGTHEKPIDGAVIIPDGRVVSWSHDETVRMWEANSGRCLAVLRGHTSWIAGAMLLDNGSIFSWAANDDLRIWDARDGRCLETVKAWRANPEQRRWQKELGQRLNCAPNSSGFQTTEANRVIGIRPVGDTKPFAYWHSQCLIHAHAVSFDGMIVAGQDNCEICILKLHHGNRRISLAEAEEILALQRKQAD